ncbi:mechanosensitive ion channel [Halalkalibacterium ligniniphilum]|uniref:mechanosensitive ion channel n=1 Tax=Halalkalibacterium ligniniphilum TaxID=1134413 RepID=UPI00034DC893|nr:mechanosensitive ion channel [Halalkalibacterium ligniniphilum]
MFNLDAIEGVILKFYETLPMITAAIFLLLLAWVVAKISKFITKSLINKVKFPKFVHAEKEDPEPVVDQYHRTQLANTVGSIAYYVVFILFIPSILDALNMTSVSQLISNMMEQVLGFLPNLFIATVIFVVGFIIARLVRDLLVNVLNALDFDRFFNKIDEDNDQRPQSETISRILANIVMVIIVTSVVTIALEALNIETISSSIVTILSSILSIIPNLFVAVILMTVGYYIATFISRLLTRLLQNTGINRLYEAFGFSSKSKTFDLSEVIGKVVKVLIILFFTVEALTILQLHVFSQIGNAVIVYLPLLFSAILILGIGLFLGNLLKKTITHYTNNSFSASLVKYIIILFAVFMTLEQLELASSIVNIGFLLILGGLSIAFAISFGIGGQEFAKRQLNKFERKIKEDTQNDKG